MYSQFMMHGQKNVKLINKFDKCNIKGNITIIIIIIIIIIMAVIT